MSDTPAYKEELEDFSAVVRCFNERHVLREENARLRAERDALLQAAEVAYEEIYCRGKHANARRKAEDTLRAAMWQVRDERQAKGLPEEEG